MHRFCPYISFVSLSFLLFFAILGPFSLLKVQLRATHAGKKECAKVGRFWLNAYLCSAYFGPDRI